MQGRSVPGELVHDAQDPGADETSNQPGLGNCARLLVPADRESLTEEQVAAQDHGTHMPKTAQAVPPLRMPHAPTAPTMQGQLLHLSPTTNSVQHRDLLMRGEGIRELGSLPG